MSTKAISLQECLIIFAYIKFLASLHRKEEKSLPEAENLKPEKPHRAERVNRPIKRPRQKLTEVLAQAPMLTILITKVWTIFRHSTPLECKNVYKPFLFSLRSNITPLA